MDRAAEVRRKPVSQWNNASAGQPRNGCATKPQICLQLCPGSWVSKGLESGLAGSITVSTPSLLCDLRQVLSTLQLATGIWSQAHTHTQFLVHFVSTVQLSCHHIRYAA